MRRNRESQRRQYDFAEQATTLGWSRDRVVVLDEDQGRSGAIPYARTGFGKLASAVARGEAGIVMSLELSRLARNDADPATKSIGLGAGSRCVTAVVGGRAG